MDLCIPIVGRDLSCDERLGVIHSEDEKTGEVGENTRHVRLIAAFVIANLQHRTTVDREDRVGVDDLDLAPTRELALGVGRKETQLPNSRIVLADRAGSVLDRRLRGVQNQAVGCLGDELRPVGEIEGVGNEDPYVNIDSFEDLKDL